MKKISLSLMAIAFAINFSYGQYLPLTAGSGNALTGTLYNNLTSGVILSAANATTGPLYSYFGNTSSFLTYGIEGSAGGLTTIGSSPYAGIISQGHNAPLQFGTNNIVRVTIDGSGKVGIGTNSPSQLLEVNGGYAQLNGLRINGSDLANSIYSNTDIGITTSGGASGLHLLQNNNQYFTGGYVGIGTSSPAYKLDVNGGVHTVGTSEFGGGSFHVSTDQSFAGGASYTFRAGVGINNPNGSSFASGTSVMSIGAMSNGVSLITTGNVGIGTTNPDKKLTVKGSIHSQEVIVDMSVLPDYVFKPTYHLPTLTEIKTYIDQNHHLPEMPSAEQVAKDGLSLGDMNAKLLKKVEELTLYLIDQNKKNNVREEELKNQQSELNNQKNINQSLQQEIDELKKQVSTLIKSKQ